MKFFRAFGALDCRPEVLPFFPFEMRRDYAATVAAADLVYVGGGNTPAMLAVWREAGFDRALRAAYEAGTVLAGISAGANCWFERYVTDSVPGGGVKPGLGWLAGTFCPHLDGEPWRQSVLAAEPAPAVGAGDGVVCCTRTRPGPGRCTAVRVRRCCGGGPPMAPFLGFRCPVSCRERQRRPCRARARGAHTQRPALPASRAGAAPRLWPVGHAACWRAVCRWPSAGPGRPSTR